MIYDATVSGVVEVKGVVFSKFGSVGNFLSKNSLAKLQQSGLGISYFWGILGQN